MTEKLPPVVELTAKQATFVQAIASGMLSKDAYRLAFDTQAEDKCVSVMASEEKRRPNVALALREVLRSKRLQDIDSVGEVLSDTKEDQQAAREAGAFASVVAANRLRGNWQGIERQGIVFGVESLLSDDELVERLSGGDPKRLAAARVLLGVAEGFPEGEPPETEDAETTS